MQIGPSHMSSARVKCLGATQGQLLNANEARSSSLMFGVPLALTNGMTNERSTWLGRAQVVAGPSLSD